MASIGIALGLVRPGARVMRQQRTSVAAVASAGVPKGGRQAGGQGQQQQQQLSLDAQLPGRSCTPAQAQRSRRPAVQCRANIVVASAAAPAEEPKSDLAKTMQFGFVLFMWYFFNAVFAIFNKRTLNVFPYPWLLSWVQLACGAAFMLVVWALRIYPAPKVSWSMIKALVPVTVLHLIGHVAGCASYNFSSISFMQIVKAAEPVVSVLMLSVFYGERYTAGIWLSLVPIVCGVAVVSATEVNFAWAGFAAAMISNFAFVFRNIFSKQMQKDIGLKGINLYAWMSIVGTVLLLPISLLVEGSKITAGFNAATLKFPASGAVPFMYLGADTPFWIFLIIGGLFYHLYNQTSYMALEGISPLTYSICNTIKRVVVIIAGIAVFRNPIPPVNAIASAVAIAGTWFYSRAEMAANEAKAKAKAAKAA